MAETHTRTKDPYKWASVSAADDVNATPWFRPERNGKDYILAEFSLTSGTGTVVLEGRLGATSSGVSYGAVTLATLTGTDGGLFARFPEMRFRATAATNLVGLAGFAEFGDLVG